MYPVIVAVTATFWPPVRPRAHLPRLSVVLVVVTLKVTVAPAMGRLVTLSFTVTLTDAGRLMLVLLVVKVLVALDAWLPYRSTAVTRQE